MNTKESYASSAEFKEQSRDFAENCLTLPELAFLAGTTAEIIAQLADLDLIAPRARSESPVFQADAVRQVRKILRMRRHLQINFDSMALIFDLLDRIEELEKKCKMQNEE